jgi:hypothetical protein
LKWWAEKYVDNGAYCLKHKINVGGPILPAEKARHRVKKEANVT